MTRSGAIEASSVRDHTSVAALAKAIDRHEEWLAGHRDARQRLEERRAQHAGSLVARRVAEVLDELPAELLHLPMASLDGAVVQRLIETPSSRGIEGKP